MADPYITDAGGHLLETVPVGGKPGLPNRDEPATPPQLIELAADPAQEYAATDPLWWYANRPHAVPWAIDDLTTDFGEDIYERMMVDDQVCADVEVLKASVLEDGLNLGSAVEDADADGYAQAAELTDVCARMLEDLAAPLDDVLWDMMDAVAVGYRVAEQVYRLDSTYTGRQMLALTALKPKPRSSTAFVVDSYNTVLGLLARIPGTGAAVQSGTFYLDLERAPNILPREKFAVFTFRPRDGDPRGRSILRAAYGAWWQKKQTEQEFLKYLTQFASASLVASPAPIAQARVLKDASGNPILDAHGVVQTASPTDALLKQLTTFRNGGILVLPNGATLDVKTVPGNGEAFLAALARYDRRISKAILKQTLASDEGQHNARAAAQVHQDILDTIIRQIKRAVVRMLRYDVLRVWVRYNYGPAYLPLVPVATLGQTEQADFAVEGTAIAALQTSGYLDPSQHPGIDRRLGLPERTEATGDGRQATEDGDVEQAPEGDDHADA